MSLYQEQLYLFIPEIKSLVYEAIGRNMDNNEGIDFNMFMLLKEQEEATTNDTK